MPFQNIHLDRLKILQRTKAKLKQLKSSISKSNTQDYPVNQFKAHESIINKTYGIVEEDYIAFTISEEVNTRLKSHINHLFAELNPSDKQIDLFTSQAEDSGESELLLTSLDHGTAKKLNQNSWDARAPTASSSSRCSCQEQFDRTKETRNCKQP